MDCKNARLLLEFDSPVTRELDDPEAGALDQHLEQCPDCFDYAQSNRLFDDSIGAAMVAVEIPKGLSEKIKTRLNARRDVWYRGFVFRVGSAAAAILLIAFLAWNWKVSQRTGVPPVTEVQREYHKRQYASLEEINAWLKQVGGNFVTAPNQFDYANHFSSYEMVEFEGKLVPCLNFTRVEESTSYYAKVYVLTDKQFDFDTIAEKETQSGFGGPRVAILNQEPPNSRIRFLTIFTGQDLDPFLKPKSGPEA